MLIPRLWWIRRGYLFEKWKEYWKYSRRIKSMPMSKGWSLIRFWLLASRHLLKYLHNVHSDTLESIILMFYRYGARAEPHAYKLYQRNTNFFDYVLIPQKPTKFYSFPKFSSTPSTLGPRGKIYSRTKFKISVSN